MEKTVEYGEKHYYYQKTYKQKLIIEPNLFWLDLAKHFLHQTDNSKFMSTNFIYCNSSYT